MSWMWDGYQWVWNGPQHVQQREPENGPGMFLLWLLLMFILMVIPAVILEKPYDWIACLCLFGLLFVATAAARRSALLALFPRMSFAAAIMTELIVYTVLVWWSSAVEDQTAARPASPGDMTQTARSEQPEAPAPPEPEDPKPDLLPPEPPPMTEAQRAEAAFIARCGERPTSFTFSMTHVARTMYSPRDVRHGDCGPAMRMGECWRAACVFRIENDLGGHTTQRLSFDFAEPGGRLDMPNIRVSVMPDY